MKKKNSGTRRRIETIDIAKAIAIFCVILGHTTGNLDTPLFRRVLYSEGSCIRSICRSFFSWRDCP